MKYAGILAVFLILATEFCERFTFHQLKTILPYFLEKQFGIGNSNLILHAFIATAYATPLIASWLADSYTGKFPIIVVLTIVYIVGQSLLTLAAILPRALTGPNITISFLAVAGLIVTSLGTGYKPSIAAMGGDQLDQKSWSLYFQIYYMTFNAGSLLSILLVQFVKREDIFWITFVTPIVLMTVALFIFMIGFQMYSHVRPKGRNVIFWLLGVTIAAMANYSQYTKETNEYKTSDSDIESVSAPAARQSLLSKSNWDDDKNMKLNEITPKEAGDNEIKANTENNSEEIIKATDEDLTRDKEQIFTLENANGNVVNTHKYRNSKSIHKVRIRSHFYDAATLSGYTKHDVAVTQSVMSLLFQLSPIIIYWGVYEQYSSKWISQASMMDRQIGSFTVDPQNMHVLNPALILITLPIIGVLTKLLRLRPLQKISIGLLICIFGYIVAIGLEILVTSYPYKMHILFQLPQIVLMTISEVLVAVTSIEFAYGEAPTHLKTLITAIPFTVVALGSGVIVISQLVQQIILGKLRYSSVFEMILFLSLLLLGFVVFVLLSLSYEYKCGTKLTEARVEDLDHVYFDYDEATAREADEFSFNEETPNEEAIFVQ